MCLAWGQYVVSMLYDIILFQNLLLPSLKFCDQCCDHIIRGDWCDSVTDHYPNPRVLKIEKWKINWKENKSKKENKKRLSLLSVILTLLQYKLSCFNQSKGDNLIAIEVDSCFTDADNLNRTRKRRRSSGFLIQH